MAARGRLSFSLFSNWSVKTLIHLITSYQTTWGNKSWPHFFLIIDSIPNKNHYSRSVWDTKVLTKNIFLSSREHCWPGSRKGLAGSLNTTVGTKVPGVSQGISRSESSPRGLFRFKMKLSCWKQDKYKQAKAFWAGKMALQLRGLPALPEGGAGVPCAHIRRLTSTCSSSSSALGTVLGPPRSLELV